MNPELPKPMLDALARETAPVDHPSADALAAFVERTLASEENRQITEHLARCGDCRETVFLASGATEESEVEQRELVAAAAAQITLQPATEAARSWARRLAWAMPVAAGFLIAAGVLVWRQAQRSRQGVELATKVESKVEERPAAPAPAIATQQPSTEGVLQSPERKPAPKTSAAKSATSKTPSAVGERPSPSVADAMGVEEAVKSAAPVAKDEAAKIAIGGPVTAAPAGQAGTRALAAAPSKRESLANAPAVSSVAVLNRMAVSPRARAASQALPITIEVKQDVEVTQAYSQESRGKLRLGDVEAQAFRLRKGQRFQMVEIGQEGSCRIKFEGKEYGLTSCPWLDGFSDHQTDIFSIVTEK
jgi:Putative zinc-finger